MKRLFLIFVLSSIALSHDLWIEREGNSYSLYYGHLHPQAGEEKFIKYKPDDVIKFECYDVKGKLILSRFEKSYPAKLKGISCATVYALFSSGYWTKSVEGLKNQPKDKVSGAIESWLSYESVKGIYSWTKALSKPLTEDLEIVPSEDPLNLKVGEKLRFFVFYRGKPLKDVVVAYDEHPIGTTDDDGGVNVRIKHHGLQNISASIREKADGVKADYTVRTANLIFEVK